MAKLLPKRLKVKPGSSPDRTHIKVDYETILKRRGRRTPLDYIKSITGIKTMKDLKLHLKRLSKTYVISQSFIEACEQVVSKREEEKKEKEEKEKEKAPKIEELKNKKKKTRRKN